MASATNHQDWRITLQIPQTYPEGAQKIKGFHTRGSEPSLLSNNLNILVYI